MSFSVKGARRRLESLCVQSAEVTDRLSDLRIVGKELSSAEAQMQNDLFDEKVAASLQSSLDCARERMKELHDTSTRELEEVSAGMESLGNEVEEALEETSSLCSNLSARAGDSASVAFERALGEAEKSQDELVELLATISSTREGIDGLIRDYSSYDVVDQGLDVLDEDRGKIIEALSETAEGISDLADYSRNHAERVAERKLANESLRFDELDESTTETLGEYLLERSGSMSMLASSTLDGNGGIDVQERLADLGQYSEATSGAMRGIVAGVAALTIMGKRLSKRGGRK